MRLLEPKEVLQAYGYYEQGWTLRRLAQKYGVTYHDVRNSFLAEYGTLRRGSVYSMTEVGEILGLPSSAHVRRWIRDEELPAYVGKTQRKRIKCRKLWVTDSDLMAFLEKQEKWMRWNPQDITIEDIRDWAIELRRPHKWQWLAMPEAATLLVCNRRTVCEYIRQERLPAVFEGKEWFVRSDNVEALAEKLRRYPSHWGKAFKADKPRFAA